MKIQIAKDNWNANLYDQNHSFVSMYGNNLMEEVGFRVTIAEHFDRPTPLDGENGLRNWIKMFGSQLFEGIDETRIGDI